MARANKFWRTLTVLGAAVLALSLATAAFAQAPPSPPHQFFGSAADGSGATVDGAAAADGAAVIAWNEDGVNVGESTVDGGLWLIQVSADDAATVTFTVDGNQAVGTFDVESGALTAVTLAATAAAGDAAADDAAADDAAADDVDEDDVAADEDAADDVAADDDVPAALPNTGSGGLADGGSGLPVLPLVLALTVVVALGGVAATRRSLS